MDQQGLVDLMDSPVVQVGLVLEEELEDQETEDQ